MSASMRSRNRSKVGSGKAPEGWFRLEITENGKVVGRSALRRDRVRLVSVPPEGRD